MTAISDALALVPGTHPALPIAGVRCVPAQGYTALLSEAPVPAVTLPQTRRAALAKAAARMALLEAAMPYGPVLPFQPGTHLSPAAIAPFMTANRPLLDQLAGRLAGHVQFQITVSWSPDMVLQRFRDTPELQSIFATGQTDALQLQQAISALAARLSSDMAELIAGPVTESLILPQAEDLLLNIVVLVPETAQDGLDDTLAAVDAIWPEGLHIRQIGPAPAASFASLSVTHISPQDVTAAYTTLGLPHAAPEPDLAEARANSLRRAPRLAQSIKSATTLAEAYLRVGEAPFDLCTIVAEGQSQATTGWKGAA